MGQSRKNVSDFDASQHVIAERLGQGISKKHVRSCGVHGEDMLTEAARCHIVPHFVPDGSELIPWGTAPLCSVCCVISRAGKVTLGSLCWNVQNVVVHISEAADAADSC